MKALTHLTIAVLLLVMFNSKQVEASGYFKHHSNGYGHVYGSTDSHTLKAPLSNTLSLLYSTNHTHGVMVLVQESSELPLKSANVIADAKKNLVEAAYPEFQDFEDYVGIGGVSVVSIEENGVYYFAYLTLGNGVSPNGGTCFKVDTDDQVSLIGYYKATGRADGINLKNCTAIIPRFWGPTFTD